MLCCAAESVLYCTTSSKYSTGLYLLDSPVLCYPEGILTSFPSESSTGKRLNFVLKRILHQDTR